MGRGQAGILICELDKSNENLGNKIYELCKTMKKIQDERIATYAEAIQCLGLLGDDRIIDLLFQLTENVEFLQSVKGSNAFDWQSSKILSENAAVILKKQLELSATNPKAVEVLNEIKQKAKTNVISYKNNIEKIELLRRRL